MAGARARLPTPVTEELSPEGAAVVAAFAVGLDHPDDRAVGHRLTGLARVLMAKGQRADAHLLCRQAGRMCSHPEVRAQARHVSSDGVPGWHRALVQDPVRATAYDRAIRGVVRPGALVLDIGTGSGLLAMMAARAGAGLVVACERDPVLARAAQDVVEENGLAGRVRVVARDSQELVVGDDLPRRADVVVSEVISNDVVGEGARATMRAARRDLLAADAVAVPIRARVCAALVASDAGGCRLASELAGFDLSAFAAVLPPVAPLRNWRGLALRSEAVELYDIDLSGQTPPPAGAVERVTARVQVQGTGPVAGIVQWMDLDLADGVRLGSGPGAPPTVWGPQLHRFDRDLPVVDGQVLTMGARCEEHGMMIWAEG